MTRGGEALLAVALASAPVAVAVGQADTFADSATASLIERARNRYQVQDSRLRGYRADVYNRMDGSVGPSRFARGLRVMAYETLSEVQWQRPNDLRVDVVGMRSKSFRIPGLSERALQTFWMEVFASEPWFVPRTLGEEIQILGVPDEPALHPLARDAARYYRYAISDSITLVIPGRVVRAIAVVVKPKEFGPMLVSGDMWLDADSLDVVRLTVAFVGEHLWEEEDDAPVMTRLEADLEYALHEGQYWLPLRQLLAAGWTYKYMPGAKLTSTAVTTFSNFAVDPDEQLAFSRRRFRVQPVRDWTCDGPAGLLCGDGPRTTSDYWEDGRWEVNLVPFDSLLAYDFGSEFEVHAHLLDEELLTQRLTQLASHSEALPAEWTGRRLLDLDWHEAARFVGFNRVQGLSVALGTELRTPIAFTTLSVAGRFSTADTRLTGSLAWRRAAPRGMVEIAAVYRAQDVEPWTNGLGAGNSAKALFLGHDDADYYRATGGGISYTGYRGATRDLRLSFAFERQRTLVADTRSVLHDVFFGDGEFPANPAVEEGDFVRVSASRSFQLGPSTIRVGAGGLMGEGHMAGRSWASVEVPFEVWRRRVRLGLRGGSTFGDRLPQFDFRVGGPATVRGYDYGTRRGAAFWSAQLETVLADNEWAAPVVFADAGSLLDGTDALVSVGAGASLFKGWMRIDFAKAVADGAPLRVDITFQPPR